MTQIIKVILKDGSSIHSDFFIDGLTDARFQERILDELDRWDVENYAEDNLGLVDEDDVESDINDFSDETIKTEYKHRGLGVVETNLIKEDLITRFSKVLEVANPIELEELVFTLEKKHLLR